MAQDFGATGGTGWHLVSRGLQAGHRVTAVARDPDRLDARHDRLEVVRADVRRFVGISAAPVAVDDEGDRLLYRLTVRPLLRALVTHVYADLALMEAGPDPGPCAEHVKSSA